MAAGGGSYTTGDLSGRNVDLRLDLRNMSEISDASFDLVWASHVLEEVDDDEQAVKEIGRVLAASGIAVLPVPIVADQTVEFETPSKAAYGNQRAPGLDYYERYSAVFRSVSVITSADAPPSIQPWVFEDRTIFPTKALPERPAQAGDRHMDAVPVCQK